MTPKKAARKGNKASPLLSKTSSPEDPLDSPLVAEIRADSMGLVRGANDAFVRLWGFSDAREARGSPFVQLFRNKEKVPHFFSALERVGIWEGCLEAWAADRSAFQVRIRARLVHDRKGHRKGFRARFVKVPKCPDP